MKYHPMQLILPILLAGCGGDGHQWINKDNGSDDFALNSEIFFYSTRKIQGVADIDAATKSGKRVPASSLTDDFHLQWHQNDYSITTEDRGVSTFDGYFGRLDYGPHFRDNNHHHHTDRRKMPINSGLALIRKDQFFSVNDSNRSFVGALGSTESGKLTLFVHGYNVSPKKALESSVALDQLFNYELVDGKHHALKQAGTGTHKPERLTLSYLWPSQGRHPLTMAANLLPYIPWYATKEISGREPWPAPSFAIRNDNIHTHYLADVTLVDFAAIQLAGLMGTLQSEAKESVSESFEIDIVAHSMGTEVLAKAFLILEQTKLRTAGKSARLKALGFGQKGVPDLEMPRIRNVVLMGGDIPVDKLVRVLPNINLAPSGRILVILNRKDTVVRVSASFQRNLPRLSTVEWPTLAGKVRNTNDFTREREASLTILDITKAARGGPLAVLKDHNPLRYPWAAQAVKHFLREGKLDAEDTELQHPDFELRKIEHGMRTTDGKEGIQVFEFDHRRH